jgi:diaminopimelate decarboxylase
VMAGTYNTRPMPAEVLVKGRKAAVVRQRQKVKAIWEDESIAPWQK